MTQAAAFLTNENKFWNHACQKGLKGGDFKPILKWYELIDQNNDRLLSLVAEDPDSLKNIMQVISAGLSSQNYEVATKCCIVLGSMIQGQQDPIEDADIQKIILNEAIASIKVHDQIAPIVSRYVLGNLYEDQYALMIESIEEIDRQLIPEVILDCGIENDVDLTTAMLLKSIQSFDAEKELSMRILFHIWKLNPKILELKSTGDDPSQIMSVLDLALRMVVRACRDENEAIRIWAQALTFERLNELAQAKSSQSPSLYKLLTFSFIENFGEETTREHMALCFAKLFQQHKNIPVGILLEPLIKKMKLEYLNEDGHEGCLYSLLHFDVKLLECLIDHRKLKLESAPNMPGGGTAMELQDLLAQCFIQKPTDSMAIAPLLLRLYQRFYEFESMQQFMKKFITVCMDAYLKSYQDFAVIQKSSSDTDSEFADLLVKRGSSIKIAQSLLEISHTEQFRAELMLIMKQAQKNHVKQFKAESKTIAKIIDTPPSPSRKVTLQASGVSTQSENESLNNRMNSIELQKSNSYWNSNDDALERMANELPAGERNVFKRHQSMAVPTTLKDQQATEEYLDEYLLKNEKTSPKGSRSPILSPKKRRSPQNSRSPKGSRSPKQVVRFQEDTNEGKQAEMVRRSSRDRPGAENKAKALQQIEKIKAKKEEQARQKQEEEERQRQKELRQKRNLEKKRRKESVALGLAAPNKEEIEANLQAVEEVKTPMEANNPGAVVVYEKRNGRVRSSQRDLSKKDGGPGGKSVQFVDLSQEEQRDQDAIAIIVQKYSKLFKFLFGKYAMSRSQTTKVADFDFYSDKTANLAEISKMMRDYGISQQMMNKNNLSDIFRSINFHYHKRSDLSELDYNLFIHYIFQASCFIFKHEKPSQNLQDLIQYFRDYAFQKGQSTGLFDDPKGLGNLSKHQKDKIKEIEDRLNQNAEGGSIYPPGYNLIKETEQTVEYKVPKMFEQAIGESKTIALELLDEVLFDAVGIHLLEPIVKMKTMNRVRPKLALGRIEQQTSQSVPQFEDLSKRSRSVRKLSPIRHSMTNQSTEVSKEMSRTAQDEQSQSNQSVLLPPRPGGKPPRANKAIMAKQAQHVMQQEEQLQKANKFKKRQQELKRAMSEQRSRKEIRDKEKAVSVDENQKLEAERQAKEKAAQKEKQRQKKEMVEKARKQKQDAEEEMNRGRQLEKEKEKREKSRASRDFIAKQKEKLSQEFEAKQKEREQAEINEVVENLRKKDEKKKLQARMSKYYQGQGQELKELEQKEKEALKAFYAQDETQKVLSNHQDALFPIFKKYATQDKKQEIGEKVALRDDKNPNMTCPEFLKFSKQFGLDAQKEMNQEDLQQIFRATVRDRDEQEVKDEDGKVDSKAATMIAYTEFQRALIRAHLVYASAQQARAADQANDPQAKPPLQRAGTTAVDQSRRVLQLDALDPASLETFLQKLEGKNLGGYSANPAIKRGYTTKESTGASRQNDPDQSTFDETADGKQLGNLLKLSPKNSPRHSYATTKQTPLGQQQRKLSPHRNSLASQNQAPMPTIPKSNTYKMPFDISAESKMEQMSMQPTPAQNQPSKFSDLRQDDENDIENSMLNPPDTVKVKKTNNVKINFDSDEKEAINRIHDGGDENY